MSCNIVVFYMNSLNVQCFHQIKSKSFGGLKIILKNFTCMRMMIFKNIFVLRIFEDKISLLLKAKV